MDQAFVDKFSCALAIECADKGIIVQCVLPGLVATKMSKVDDSSFLTPDPKQYVEASFRTLGIETRSAAFWYHRIMVIRDINVGEGVTNSFLLLIGSFILEN